MNDRRGSKVGCILAARKLQSSGTLAFNCILFTLFASLRRGIKKKSKKKNKQTNKQNYFR